MPELAIPEVRLSGLRRFGDARGYFFESFRAKDHPETAFVQDNVSFSAPAGTVRGLHFQSPPFAQAKLVTVLRGAIFDVAVDLRRGSPTYGRWVSAELSAENMRQFFVPRGFAHGFCTLVADTMVLYKTDNYYAPEHDSGILWNDHALGIDWPVEAGAAVLSDKDRVLPRFADLASPFVYGGGA